MKYYNSIRGTIILIKQAAFSLIHTSYTTKNIPKKTFKPLKVGTFSTTIIDNSNYLHDSTIELKAPSKIIESLLNKYFTELEQPIRLVPIIDTIYKELSYKWLPSFELDCGYCKEPNFEGYQNAKFTQVVNDSKTN